jgi:hypothetical protein
MVAPPTPFLLRVLEPQIFKISYFPVRTCFVDYSNWGGSQEKIFGAKYSLTSPLKPPLLEFLMVTPVFLSTKQNKKKF